MSGILFFGVVAAWGAVAFHLAKWLSRRIEHRFLGFGLGASSFVLMMVLPVADEIVGGYQFRALCKEGTALKINAGKAKGRTVKVVVRPLNEALSGKAVTIYHSHESFQDVATSEEIASNDWYVAKGGWLIRLLGVSETNGPITFDPSACYPSLERQEVAKAYGFSLTK